MRTAGPFPAPALLVPERLNREILDASDNQPSWLRRWAGKRERQTAGGAVVPTLRTRVTMPDRVRWARCTSARGFTLAELITALALALVVGAVSTPVASRLYRQYAFQNATRQLGFEVTRARMQAIGQNAFVRIRFIGSNSYVRERSTDGVSFTQEGPAVTLPSSTTGYAIGSVSFNRQGLANSGAWLVLIDYAAESYSVLYNNVLGRVTTSMGNW